MDLSISNLSSRFVLPQIFKKERELLVSLGNGDFLRRNKPFNLTAKSLEESKLNILAGDIKDKTIDGAVQLTLIPFHGQTALFHKTLIENPDIFEPNNISYLRKKGRNIFRDTEGSVCDRFSNSEISGKNCVLIKSPKVRICDSSSNIVVLHSPRTSFFNCKNIIAINCKDFEFKNLENKIVIENKVTDLSSIEIPDFENEFSIYDFTVHKFTQEEIVVGFLGTSPDRVKELIDKAKNNPGVCIEHDLSS